MKIAFKRVLNVDMCIQNTCL